MPNKDYTTLYKLQDKFLEFWSKHDYPFYLTGGTALGRYWLNHRYSEDLDFFVNNDKNFKTYIQDIQIHIAEYFKTDKSQNVVYDTFARFFITENNGILKLDFVNDTPYRTGKPIQFDFLLLDTPENILSNKLSAILNREEPKDIFDIIHIALNYEFNWHQIFNETKQKALQNEIDTEQKLKSFPVELFEYRQWLFEQADFKKYTEYINRIADDFITGSDNSLCQTGIKLAEATVNIRI